MNLIDKDLSVTVINQSDDIKSKVQKNLQVENRMKRGGVNLDEF